MPIQSIQAPTAEEWLASLPEQGPTVIYKHSPFCGISARADQRPLSEAIARLLGVTHSSPQVIVVEQGHAVWNESHYGITVEALEEQVAP